MGEQPFAELKGTVLRTILARRITLGVFAAVALVVILTSRISYLNPLFYAPLAWFLITFPFQYLVNRQRSERSLHWVHAGFFIVEIVLITLFVHLMGGSEWIGIVFYIFTVIYANFFLPKLQGYLVTALVILLYTLVVLLEYTGAISHQFLFPVHDAPYRSLSYNLTTILAGAVGIYSVLAYTVRSFTNIYARKNRILAARESELAELSQRLLSAHEEERRRIARELHDNLSQSLAAVKLHLAALKDEISPDKAKEVLGIIDQAVTETRTLAYSLRPPLLDDLGLLPSLRRLGEMVKAASGLEMQLNLEEGKRLPRPVESLLFHVAQEAIRNVQKHAQAKHVVVTLHRESGKVILAVKDDGIGFRPQDPQGLGLRGIKERVEVTGGRMEVTSSPGCGALVSAEVPYEAD
ncbi:TPA: hypothetical protein DIT45_02175 [Candidatus Acetothermia bacterium]|nr:hypothetical protein [Candidatus Acetothermia bacterium]